MGHPSRRTSQAYSIDPQSSLPQLIPSIDFCYDPAMSASLQLFIVIFFIGVLCRASGWLGKAHAERLAALVFSVSLPATILVSLDRMTFSTSAWRLPLAACIVTGSILLCSWVLARLLRLPRTTQGGFLLGTGCINSVYFAYPVVLAKKRVMLSLQSPRLGEPSRILTGTVSGTDTSALQRWPRCRRPSGPITLRGSPWIHSVLLLPPSY